MASFSLHFNGFPYSTSLILMSKWKCKPSSTETFNYSLVFFGNLWLGTISLQLLLASFSQIPFDFASLMQYWGFVFAICHRSVQQLFRCRRNESLCSWNFVFFLQKEKKVGTPVLLPGRMYSNGWCVQQSTREEPPEVNESSKSTHKLVLPRTC